MPVNTVST